MPRGRARWIAGVTPYLTMGIQLAVAAVVFFFVGRWLDGLLGTDPWLMLLGLALGIGGGFLKFFRAAISLGREADNEARRAARGRPHDR